MRILKKEREGLSKEQGGLDHMTFSIDRTWEEREEYRRLKRELEIRTANGEQDLGIRRNRVVKLKQPFRNDPPEGGRH